VRRVAVLACQTASASLAPCRLASLNLASQVTLATIWSMTEMGLKTAFSIFSRPVLKKGLRSASWAYPRRF
jgi:hypothetical protein